MSTEGMQEMRSFDLVVKRHHQVMGIIQKFPDIQLSSHAIALS